jgi:hypothetical protein
VTPIDVAFHASAQRAQGPHGLSILLIWLSHIIAKVIFESSYSCKAAEEVPERMIAKSTVDNPDARSRELRLEFLQSTSVEFPLNNRFPREYSLSSPLRSPGLKLLSGRGIL